MRVVVTGASGNVGSAVLRSLATEGHVTEVVGLARRRPDVALPKVTWVTGDVVDHDLVGLFRGAGAVVHLAWLLQPSRDRATTHAVNVDGTARVLAAVAEAGVATVVVASSVAAYGPGPSGDDGTRVDETWPTTGVPTSFYSREKVAVEGLVDRFEEERSAVRVVRLRPGLIFQRSAAQEIRRLFLGPLFPNALVRPGRMPLAPVPRGLRLQLVHADDVAEAYRLAIVRPDAHGAYNVAVDPVIDGRAIRKALGGLPVPIPQRVLRATAKLTWRARLQPTPPGWVDLGLQSPLMDSARLRALGWTPRHDGDEALLELLAGLRDGSGGATPPLRADAGGRFRIGELRSGVGARSRG